MANVATGGGGNNTPSEKGGTPIPSSLFTPKDNGGTDGGSDGFVLVAPPKDGGGGGGGGGGAKKVVDPYAPVIRSFFSAYFKIWGTLPPPGYVEQAARSMNLYEFIDQERKKPAYRHTKAYRDQAAKYAALRDQVLGYY